MTAKVGLLTCAAVAAFLFIGLGEGKAQTIATSPLPNSSYCLGDSLTVSFTVAGGSFTQGNAFIVQLSDSLGNFDGKHRRILGSTNGTGSGSMEVRIPTDISPGDDFRIRVVGSNPVVIGSDNGSDFSIFRRPDASLRNVPTTAVVGVEVTFNAWEYDPRQTYSWNFGDGATPATATTDDPTSPPVTYSTVGRRTLTVSVLPESGAGCPLVLTSSIDVIAANPEIPSTAIIVTGDTALDGGNSQERRYVWVCPGGTLRIGSDFHSENLVIFAEFGAVVDMERASFGTVYLKSGAEVRNLFESDNIHIIAEEGASIAGGGSYRLFEVPSITFDYSNVPANGCPSLAPYTVQITPDSRSIHTNSSEEGSQQKYLVSAGTTFTSTGDGNVYLVEIDASLIVRGSNSRIYLKDGASLDVLEGTGHRIFYEQGAQIESPGTEPILLPSSGITFVGAISSVETESAAARTLDIE